MRLMRRAGRSIREGTAAAVWQSGSKGLPQRGLCACLHTLRGWLVGLCPRMTWGCAMAMWEP